MDEFKFRKLISRYLKGNANETEQAVVEAFYRSYDGKQIQKIDERESARSKAEVAQALAVLTHKKTKLWYRHVGLYPVAASLLLIGTFAIILWPKQEKLTPYPPQYTRVTTRTGETKKIILPDSSELWLNSGSSVKVPSVSNNKLREVYLEEGEALFEIRKNPSRPFIVHAHHMDVRVLGTSFNVKSYKSLPNQTVQVITGKVQVSAAGKHTAVLRPGQQVLFRAGEQKADLTTVSISQINWTSGQQYLDHAGFDELALMLANHYGLKLKSGSKRAANYRFTMRVDYRQPVEEILEAISLLHNTRYRKEGEEVIIY